MRLSGWVVCWLDRRGQPGTAREIWVWLTCRGSRRSLRAGGADRLRLGHGGEVRAGREPVVVEHGYVVVGQRIERWLPGRLLPPGHLVEMREAMPVGGGLVRSPARRSVCDCFAGGRRPSSRWGRGRATGVSWAYWAPKWGEVWTFAGVASAAVMGEVDAGDDPADWFGRGCAATGLSVIASPYRRRMANRCGCLAPNYIGTCLCPKLRARWDSMNPHWDQFAAQVWHGEHLTAIDEVRQLSPDDPDTLAHAVGQTADLVAALGRRLEPEHGPLYFAGQHLARAAQLDRGQLPPPRRRGNALPLLVEVTRLVAYSRDPAQVATIVAVIVLVYSLVRLLNYAAERHGAQSAVQHQVQLAGDCLAEHPYVARSLTSQPSGTRGSARVMSPLTDEEYLRRVVKPGPIRDLAVLAEDPRPA